MITPSLPRSRACRWTGSPGAVEKCREQDFAAETDRARGHRYGSAPRLSATIDALPSLLRRYSRMSPCADDRLIGAGHQFRHSAPQRDQRLVQAEDRFACRHRDWRRSHRRNRPPAAATARPAKIRRARVASHCIGVRQPSRPTPMPGHVFLEGIAHLFRRNRHLRHADLVAVIERRRAAQVSSSIAATRACSRPTRLATRGRSWLPSTQFGHAPAGSARLVFGDRSSRSSARSTASTAARN